MLLGTIALIIEMLPNLLKNAGVITPAMSAIIAQLGAVIPNLITSLASGQPVPDEVQSVLAALQSEIQVLQSSTSLNPQDLAIALTLNAAIRDALAAYTAAEKTDDPSLLTELPTNL